MFAVTRISRSQHTAHVVLMFDTNLPWDNRLGAISEELHLTARECQAVRLLIQGLTNKEIAASMRVSVNTVKTFLHLVMVKMGTSTRAGVIGQLITRSG